MGGGKTGKSVVYNMLTFENRQLYYKIHNIPSEFKQKIANSLWGLNTGIFIFLIKIVAVDPIHILIF